MHTTEPRKIIWQEGNVCDLRGRARRVGAASATWLASGSHAPVAHYRRCRKRKELGILALTAMGVVSVIEISAVACRANQMPTIALV
jgi:hypothetical protein